MDFSNLKVGEDVYAVKDATARESLSAITSGAVAVPVAMTATTATSASNAVNATNALNATNAVNATYATYGADGSNIESAIASIPIIKQKAITIAGSSLTWTQSSAGVCYASLGAFASLLDEPYTMILALNKGTFTSNSNLCVPAFNSARDALSIVCDVVPTRLTSITIIITYI